MKRLLVLSIILFLAIIPLRSRSVDPRLQLADFERKIEIKNISTNSTSFEIGQTKIIEGKARIDSVVSTILNRNVVIIGQ